MLLRGGPIVGGGGACMGSCIGRGKSGIEPTEESVDGRERVDGVSGTDDVTPSESRMLLLGWY